MTNPALSVDEFCNSFRITKPTFYNLLKNGKGPKTYQIGRRRYISAEAARDWQKEMEATSPAFIPQTAN